MLWRTHVTGGLLAGIGLAQISGIQGVESVSILAGSALGALLPDVDSPYSTIGRKFPLLAWTIKWTAGHRGIFHSLLMAGIITAGFSVYNLHLGLGICIGYLSHLMLDSLNREGTPLLWPLEKRFAVPLVSVGGMMEKLVVFPVLAVACLFAVYQQLPSIPPIFNSYFTRLLGG